jgi:transglutaminase-like putative cysteine protease
LAESRSISRHSVTAVRLVIALGLGWGALSVATELHGRELVGLALGGLLAVASLRSPTAGGTGRELLGWSAQAACAGLLVLIARTPSLAALPVVLAWLGLLSWRRARGTAGALLATGVGVAQSLLLVELAGSAGEALESAAKVGLALTVVLALTATMLVEAAANDASRRRLPSAASDRLRPGARDRARRRAVSAAGLAALVLVLALALREAADRVVSGLVVVDLAPDTSVDPLDADPEASARRRRTSRRFPDSVEYGGALGELGQDVVLEVRANRRLGAPGRIAPELLFGALRLDRFGSGGVVLDAVPRPLADGDDGAADGWVSFPPERPWSVEFAVRSVALTVGDSDRAPLFHPGNLVSVDLEAVEWHPRGVVTTQVRPGKLVEYRVRVAEVPDVNGALSSGRAGDPGGHALELPAPSPELDHLRALATEVVGDAPDAAGAVRRVLAYFAEGYRYSFLGSELKGLEGLVDFVERREGFCSAYASTAALLLRLSGVPARVVTGYRLDEYDAERSLYVGRDDDAHAWIEVHFEQVGWVPFDPTPAAARSAAAAATANEGAIDPWLPAGATAAVVLLLHGIGRRLRRRSGTAAESGAGAAVGGWFRDVLGVLARTGYPRPRGRTPREFASDLRGAEHPEADAIGDAVELYYRERYAGLPASERERAGIGSLVRRLRARR